MRHMIRKPLLTLGLAGLFYVAVLAVSVAGSAQAATPTPKSGERLLVIHDGESQQGILTRAATVREAFEEAHIPLDANDMVEPGLDETLVASSYDINLYRARPITIIDGSIRKKIMSAYRTPAQIVKHAGMELRDEDITTTGLPAASEGTAVQLTITRATPFTLVLYGKKITAYTQAKTVGDMLKEKKIILGKDDTLSVADTTPLTASMTVELWRNGKQTVTEDKDIPFDTEKVQDTDREVGYREVKTPGVVGKRTVTYEVEMKNGQEVGRKEIQSVTTKEPVKQVEVVGVKAPPVMNPSETAELGHQMMLAYGFGEDQWPCLFQLWTRESGWRVTASNPSGAYGIPQALPGSKMGPGWQNDASVQIQWGLGYIKGRYGTPCGAWAAFNAKGWY